MKTCPCNVYPLTPLLYKKNWGLQVYTYFSYFLLQNIDCGYSLDEAVLTCTCLAEAVLTCTHNRYFEQK